MTTRFTLPSQQQQPQALAPTTPSPPPPPPHHENANAAHHQQQQGLPVEALDIVGLSRTVGLSPQGLLSQLLKSGGAVSVVQDGSDSGRETGGQQREEPRGGNVYRTTTGPSTGGGGTTLLTSSSSTIGASTTDHEVRHVNVAEVPLVQEDASPRPHAYYGNGGGASGVGDDGQAPTQRTHQPPKTRGTPPGALPSVREEESSDSGGTGGGGGGGGGESHRESAALRQLGSPWSLSGHAQRGEGVNGGGGRNGENGRGGSSGEGGGGRGGGGGLLRRIGSGDRCLHDENSQLSTSLLTRKARAAAATDAANADAVAALYAAAVRALFTTILLSPFSQRQTTSVYITVCVFFL